MVDIFPFRGLRYNLEKLFPKQENGLEFVATPPYDVINEARQEEFYALHPANFIRVDLNRKTPGDSESNNPYTRAAGFTEAWEMDQTLMPEAEPAIYAYSQSWQQNGETIERKGAIALLRLESFESGKVLPHEHTLKGPKADRIQLMRQTLCNLSQVFMIYSDPQQTLEKLLYPDTTSVTAEKWTSATDSDGVTHRFRPVSNLQIIQPLQALFKEKTLLIADGHHRYETALAYQQEVREQLKAQTGESPEPGSLLSDYAMIFLTNMDDPGLKVYPTHRILHQWPKGWDQKHFEAELFRYYEVVESDETFCYRNPENPLPVKLGLKPEAKPKNLPALLDQYDAALLEETVFKGIFATTGESLKHAHLLGFYRNENEIEALWQQHKAVAGFYLAAPSVKLVHDICEAGNRMPQKSTYFYPKILSGLVIFPYRSFLNSDEHALTGVTTDGQTPVCPVTAGSPAVCDQFALSEALLN